jgi:hypothetical protein
MNLHHTTHQYLVYLQALDLPTKRLKSFQRVLKDVESFYGPETPLEVFDNALILEYIKQNDPFETDPVKVERGAIFCKFTHWMMKNRLIPAWANEMQKWEKDKQSPRSSLEDFKFNDQFLL